jgi:outer membrane biogenesis lipoprotein LolB
LCMMPSRVYRPREFSVGLIALLAGCAVTAPEKPLHAGMDAQATEGYAAALALWKQANKRRAEYRNYNTVYDHAINANHFYSESPCKAKGRDDAELILVIDSNGVISNGYTSKATPKALCFIAQAVGMQVPIPPFSPMPIRMFMMDE